MFNRLLDWIKSNKFSTLLLLVLFLFLTKDQIITPLNRSVTLDSYESAPSMGIAPGRSGAAVSKLVGPISDTTMPYNPAPPTSSADRMVIKDTFLSLLVKDVTQVVSQIESKASSLGGYLVDSNLNLPEGAASGTVTIRVPTDKRQEALESFKALGVKTVSETVSGTDVTDQYVDIQARLATLNQTKAKFEEILSSASQVSDLLEVQRELINLQTQIDNLIGQQKYLEGSAQLSKITVYLSTDELALPYTPDQPWRPEVIFKLAVRSLIANLRQLGTAAIWLAVYSPALIAIVLLALGAKRMRVNRPR